MLLLLTACGGGKGTSTKLEISSSFLMTNPYFGGGLIITGRNLATNEHFSQSIVASSSIRFPLTSGRWEFAAIGWDGGGTGSERPLAGRPYCAINQFEIAGESATINLTLKPEICGTPAFAGTTLPNDSTTYPGFPTLRKLKWALTCNSFIRGIPHAQITGAIQDHFLQPSDFNTVCDLHAPDMKSEAQSMKIYALNKGPDQLVPELGISTTCLQNASGGTLTYVDLDSVYGSIFPLRLPLKTIPLGITLYKDPNCDETRIVTRFQFKEGLQTVMPGQQHLLQSNDQAGVSNTEIKLVLAANEFKKGFSSFQHLLPFFKKNTGPAPFITEPSSVSGGAQYPVFASVPKTIRLESKTCPAEGAHINVTPGTVSCTPSLQGALVTFTATTSSMTATLVMGSESITFYADAEATGRERFETNKNIYRLLGAPLSTSNFEDFFAETKVGDDDAKYGILSKVRSMLKPDGAGGAFGIYDPSMTFQDNCLNTVGDKDAVVFKFENGIPEERRYRVQVSTVTGTRVLPNFTCHNGDYDSTCIGDVSVDKRMLIWDYANDPVLPSIALEFSCADFAGKYQDNIYDDSFLVDIQSQTIINWNTNLSGTWDKQRIETLQSTQIKTGSVLQSDKKSISRIRKIDGDNYEGHTYSYHSKRNGSNYDETLIKNNYLTMVAIPPYICFDYLNLPLSATSYKGIFSHAPFNADRSTFAGIGEFLSGTGDKFQPNVVFPQPVTGGQNCTWTAYSNLNAGNLVNGNLDFNLDSLQNLDTAFSSGFMTP